ncbi:hypothetical protein MPSEU_000822900 [Mayamaea pseudoterrestris]|nr:hypothetical protein MPSEU_000822900 [Mayamaea pseudoterrestris]
MFQPIHPLLGLPFGTTRTQSQAVLDNALESSRCKRPRQQLHVTQDNSLYAAMVTDEEDYMTVDDKADASTGLQLQEIPDKDEVLIQMLVTSGATTYDQVVDFCISCKIPLGRMLKLDLMRVIKEELPSGD